ncbi:MAG: hypothetical protein J5730_06950, partial [Bacteroidales bacterium]|nr:hypothetical protein [Bacteroidales bacterium]
IIGLLYLFFGGGRAGAAAQTTHVIKYFVPPRRRAFRYNGWQASHFHCNPSRMLAGRQLHFAANIVLTRLNVHPRRDLSPRAIPSRGCGARSSHLKLWLPRPAALRGCLRKTQYFQCFISECTPEGVSYLYPHIERQKGEI